MNILSILSKQKIITVLSACLLFVFFYTYTQEFKVVCDSFIQCLNVSYWGSPYQYVVWPLTAMILSVLPYILLKKTVFKTWLKFAAIALPLMILWILSGKEYADFLDIMKDRESITIASSILFVLISYIIFIVQSIRLKNK